MWRTIIVALALICLGLLGYYAVTKRAVQISAGLAVSANTAVQGKIAGVAVQVEQRDARLVGVVTSDALKADAARIVAGVSGVKSVKNELVVEAPRAPANPDEPKGPEAPPTIENPPTNPTSAPGEADAGSAPAADGEAPAPEVVEAAPLKLDISWDGKAIVAKGALPDGLKKDIALTFVSDFPDATVTDEIAITTDPGTPAIAKAMKTAVSALARLDSGRVVVDDADFELTGVAASIEIEAAVKKLVGDEVKAHASTVTLTLPPGVTPAPVPIDVPADGPLTAVQCQAAIDAQLDGPARITFKGPTGRVADEGDLQIQEVWKLLSRCPAIKGQIIGFHDNMGEPDKVKQLSAIRAFNVHKRLVELGMDKDRFTYAGVGQHDFKYPNKGDTRVLNQRIEFKLEVQ